MGNYALNFAGEAFTIAIQALLVKWGTDPIVNGEATGR